ncbi:sensor histidine kinase [Cellulosilyticum ruminicola]|uniref:sensor histidine kinase n=1 Tax=Cellulosilyticum ruminicola TaxID=425254 RepID=UPI0006CF35D3|nr:HAMP domain-containing sensor histidine kinase [Cellulosilyticum ruminicola]
MKERDIFRRTRKNIIVVSVGIVMAALLIYAMITAQLYKRHVFKDVDQQILMQRNQIIHAPNLIKYRGERMVEVMIPAPVTFNLLSFVWLDDKLVGKSPHDYLGDNLYPDFTGYTVDEIFTLEDGEYIYRAIQFTKQGLKIQLLINVNSEIASVKALEKSLGISFLILIVIALILASYLAVSVLNPLKILYNKQLAFIQDSSHEMRTPLAVIKGRLELLVRHKNDKVEEHYEEISIIMKELWGLEKLNSDLLLMSKEDMGMKLEITSFSLNEFISEIGEFYTDFAEIQDKQFNVNLLEEDIEVSWDKSKMKRCIVILIENALKYTGSGDEITINVFKKDKMIKIEVADTGVGIKEEDQERIFDRFFRSSEARASGKEGSGIGLSLLKSIAYGLDVKIDLRSVYGEGAKFTLTMSKQLKNS